MSETADSPVRLLERVGRSDYCEVFKGIDLRTQNVVAVKVIDLDEASESLDDFRKEVAVLTECDSPYITKYYGSFVRGKQLSILLEYLAGGSLRDLLDAGGPLDESEIAVALRDVLQALAYLHGKNRVHRDIKAANVLISAKGEVKLSDFAVSGQLSASVRHLRTFVGTPYWMAPEVISQAGHDARADIWSVGITAIELATGSAPHADQPPMRVLMAVPKQPPPQLEGDFSKSLKDFVAQCLRMDPTDRPTAKKLLEHKFIKGAKKNALLAELVERRQQKRQQVVAAAATQAATTPPSSVSPPVAEADDLVTGGASAAESFRWDFGTVRSSQPALASASGTAAAGAGPVATAGPSAAAQAAVAAAPSTGTVVARRMSDATAHVTDVATAAASDAVRPRSSSDTDTVRMRPTQLPKPLPQPPQPSQPSQQPVVLAPSGQAEGPSASSALRWLQLLEPVAAEMGASSQPPVAASLQRLSEALAAVESASPGAVRCVASALARATLPELFSADGRTSVTAATPIGALLLRKFRQAM